MKPAIFFLKQGSTILLVGRAIQLANSFGLSVVVVRKFGLETVGTFAIAFVAVTIISCLAPLGLISHMPRVKQKHQCVCYSALLLQGAVLLPVVLLVLAFAKVEAQRPEEVSLIALVSFGGFITSAMNVGLMLRIMKKSFCPGAMAPICETAGLVIGAAVATSAVQLVICQLSGRSVGLILTWSGLRFAPLSFARIVCIARRSVQYAIPDALAMLSEQIAPLLLGIMISRAELGMFRLCQQFLTGADTPGWAFVQSKYPDLVGASSVQMNTIRLQVQRLSMIASVGCCIGSCAIASFAYHLPTLDYMMVFLSGSILWRYQNHFFDQAIRAAGRVRISNVLAVGKLVLAFMLFVPLVACFGVWGAVVALGALSVIAGFGYSTMFSRSKLYTLHPEAAI
jgi:O-antigen/teichoic acid export membrane protein